MTENCVCTVMTENCVCTVCRGDNVRSSVCVENVPVLCSGLYPTRTSAQALPTACIALAFCRDCGHLFNRNFDSRLLQYDPDYDSSLHFSGIFQEYIEALANLIVERYRLREKTVVEIGCGRGDFLRLLCARGVNRAIGFDPRYSYEIPDQEPGSSLSIRREFFPGTLSSTFEADFVCSRQTLEHVSDPREFVTAVRKAIGDREIPIFFEVPNSLYTLRDGGIWDIIYEHCSYFSPVSLARIFWECDFEPIEVQETYGKQFVAIYAKTGRISEKPPILADPAIERLVDAFQENYKKKVEFWRCEMSTLKATRRKPIVWGAGAKAVTFLSLMRSQSIEYVVDINPRKQGNFIGGTGQPIVSPEFLKRYDPDVVILTNDHYSAEVRQMLEGLGLTPELLIA